jgi:hypothetical protein
MAGIFLLHLCLSSFAIIVGLISYYSRAKKAKADPKYHKESSKNQVITSQAMELESNTINVDSQKQNHRDFLASSSHGGNTDAKIDTLLSMITTVHDKEVELERKLDAVLLMMTKIQDQQK